LLGIDSLGIHDNFFELGGNSLIGLKVISRLKKEVGVNIPVVALFEGPTVSALAQVISRNRDEQPLYEESRNRGERRRARRLQKRGDA
jgi:phthiocerol/phenolphthiocerol synthesis type-I polyketide synthase E